MNVRKLIISVVVLVCFQSIAYSQTTEDEIKARLVNKPLYLRGLWREDNLHFDSYGQLVGTSGALSFTLCGIEISKVAVHGNQLSLEGMRVGVKFNKSAPVRVALKIGDKPPFSDERIEIMVDAPSDGNFAHALNAIFADDLTELAPVLPPYWQRFAREALIPSQQSGQTSSVAAMAAKKIGGALKPPTVVKSVEPQFSQAARNLRYSGKVLVNLWVGEDGLPSHLAVINPAGLGLDEQALYAVQHYTFKPATENGNPVKVELNIEVNFKIY